MKKKIISVILLSSLLLSGCSFNKNKTEITKNIEEDEKYLVTFYTYQGVETYEIKEYTRYTMGLCIITNDDKKLILQGDYKIEKIK